MEVTEAEKARLKSLLQWKRRLRDLPENKCFLKTSELLSIIPFNDSDSPSRRSGLFVLEKMTSICWQDSQYGKKPLHPSQMYFINAVYPVVQELAERIQFEINGFWFGGTDVNHADEINYNKSAFVSLCLHLIALSADVACEDHVLNGHSSITTFLSLLTRFYETSYDFSMELIEHDERCLSTIVALLHIATANISIPDQYDPRKISMFLFIQIGFDHSVVLDWLYSEIVAIPFMLRFLKDFQTHPELYSISSVDTTLRKATSPQFRRELANNEESYTLQIYQLHGEKMVTTLFKFPTSEAGAHFTAIQDVSCSQPHDIYDLIGLINDLRNTCTRLMRTEMAPFNMTRLISEMNNAIDVVKEMIPDDSKYNPDENR